MAATAERRSLKARPLPRLRIGLFYVLAFGIGLIPYALLIRSWSLWLGLVLLTSIAFLVGSRSRTEHAGEVPIALEIVPSMLGRCALSATIGFFGIGLYYGISWLRALFSASPEVGLDFWAVYVSAFMVAWLVIAIATSDLRDTINTLYPDRPGQRSPYFALAVQPSAAWRLGGRILLLIATAVGVCIVGVTDGFASHVGEAALVLNFVIMGVGADYLEAKTVDSVHGTPESAIVAIKGLLEAIGYRVIPRPRTGNEEADSVISILDFLAIRSDRAMAGRVLARPNRENSEISYEAASLEPAVWVLQDQLQQQQGVKIRLDPVLLVLGNDPTGATGDSSLALSAGKSVKIIRTPTEAELTAMINSEDKAPLREAAERLFESAVLARSAAS